jgi:hypothetical protein
VERCGWLYSEARERDDFKAYSTITYERKCFLKVTLVQEIAVCNILSIREWHLHMACCMWHILLCTVDGNAVSDKLHPLMGGAVHCKPNCSYEIKMLWIFLSSEYRNWCTWHTVPSMDNVVYDVLCPVERSAWQGVPWSVTSQFECCIWLFILSREYCYIWNYLFQAEKVLFWRKGCPIWCTLPSTFLYALCLV